MPQAEHDPSLWRPGHALDARRAHRHAFFQARLVAATTSAVAPPVAGSLAPDYRRVACPTCGHITDDESLVDVRGLSPDDRTRFGFHPVADFLCTSVCLNDAFNAGVSREAFYRALGAPAEGLARARIVDAGNPMRQGLPDGVEPRATVRRPAHRPGPLPLD